MIATNPAKKRSWFRFNLRAFIVFVTLIAFAAAWIGIQVSHRQHELAAISRLSRLNSGGTTTVVMDSLFDRLPSESLTPLSPPLPLPPSGAWKRVRNLDPFRRVVMFSSFPMGNTFDYQADSDGSVRIEREYVNGLKDEDMQAVSKLTDVRSLWLEANGITDDGLRQLGDLEQLEIIWLPLTAITDEGAAILSQFPKLRQLDLSGTYVTDASAKSLEQCVGLTHLNLTNTKFTSEGIAALQKALPGCQIDY